MQARIEEASFIAPRSLYIHIPFCRSKCSYCDFYSVVPPIRDDDEARGLVVAILDRARRLAIRFGAGAWDTVYIGGGTPSALPRGALRFLLESIADLAHPSLEWTVEANPESVDDEFLDILEGSGVSRISLGIQSLDELLLRTLGRISGPQDSLEALRKASRRNLEISADLIAGLPRRIWGEARDVGRGGLASEASALVGAGAGHLSVYDLVLEGGTALAAIARKGGLMRLDEDEAADERASMEEVVGALGLARYEISNYSLPGRESRHNLAYWRMDSYLGAGPGAVSTLISDQRTDPDTGRPGAALRIEEGRDIGAYRSGRADTIAAEDLISPRDSAFEAIMMSLRTLRGLDRLAFERRFGIPVESLIGDSIIEWKERLVDEPGRLALATNAIDFENAFLVRCLEELETSFPSA